MLLLLLACAGGPDSGGPAAEPAITFLAPLDGDTLAVGTHGVSVAVDGFALVEPKHNAGTPVGFLVVFVDGEELSTVGTPLFDVTFNDPGTVALSTALVYADGDPLDPPVEADIQLTVTP